MIHPPTDSSISLNPTKKKTFVCTHDLKNSLYVVVLYRVISIECDILNAWYSGRRLNRAQIIRAAALYGHFWLAWNFM